MSKDNKNMPSGTKPDDNSNIKFTKKQKEVIKDTISETVDKKLDSATKTTNKTESKKSNTEPPKVVIKKQVSSKKSRNLAILFSCLGGAALIGGGGALIYMLTKKSHSVVQYSVTFIDGNGRPIGNAKSYDKETTFSAITLPDTEDVDNTMPEGKYFTGCWYFDSKLTNEVTGDKKLTANATLYPGSATDSGTRTVSFEAEGGLDPSVPETQSVTKRINFSSVRTPYAYPIAQTNNEEYKKWFIGWADQFGKIITADYKMISDLKAHAVYGDASETCVVAFYVDDTYTVKSGCRVNGCKQNTTTLKNLIQPSVDWTSYDKAFKGWTLNPETKEIYDQSQIIDSDLNLYPVLEDITTYKNIHFKAGEGTFPETGQSEMMVKALKGETFGKVISRFKAPTKGDQELWYWAHEDGSRILSDEEIKDDFTCNAVYYPTTTDKFFVYYEDGKTYGWIEPDSLKSGKIKIHFSTSTTETTAEIERTAFNTDIYIGTDIASIPNDFLSGCTNFNSSINLTENIESIGDNFLKGCSAFNKELVLPSSVKTIGTNFMNQCTSFAQDFAFPSTLTTVGEGQMLDCDAIQYVELGCPLSVFATGDNNAFARNNTALKEKAIYIASTDAGTTPADITAMWPDISAQAPFRFILTTVFGDSQGLWVDYENNKIWYFDKLSTSNICSDDPEAKLTFKSITGGVTTEKEFDRTTFNEKIYFNKDKITTIPAHFLENCNAYNQEITGFENVTEIGNYFMCNCHAFNQSIDWSESLSKIGIGFMAYCSNYNQELELSQAITEIPDGFLYNCAAFNSVVILPDDLTTIGTSFMEGCVEFTPELAVPNKVTKVGERFMFNVDGITSIKLNNLASAYAKDNYTLSTEHVAAISYRNGIVIKGEQGADQFVEDHPNRTESSPYRKLRENGKTTVKFRVKGTKGGTLEYTEKKHATIDAPVTTVLPEARPDPGYSLGEWYDAATGAKITQASKIYENAIYEYKFTQNIYKATIITGQTHLVSGFKEFTYGQQLVYKFEKDTGATGTAWSCVVKDASGVIISSSKYAFKDGELTLPGSIVTGNLTIKVTWM